MVQYSVSVVVAARNEQDNILPLLQALADQTYPAEKYKVIIVDDMSEDKTVLNVQTFLEKNKTINIKLIQTTTRNVQSPKKQALELGIQHADGEILLLTDADCVPPTGWIGGMVSRFTPDVGLVAGYSPYEIPKPDGFFSWLLALDTLSLASVAAGSSGWGKMATCNGRNLAYRKKVFRQVDGFSNIRQFISGDDDLLLQQIHKHTDWKTCYVIDPATVVPTLRLKSFKQFFHQRIRHASKGLVYTKKKIIFLSAIYLFNLLLFLLIPAELLGFSGNHSAFLCLLFKSMLEFIFMYVFAIQIKRGKYLMIFPLAEILHIPYVVVFAALGQFVQFKWKTK
ncbi:glycosyltransferase [candidate division KSB1 bacterium]|nr:glycosyltransferase [candidate division KSB1 bacterium]